MPISRALHRLNSTNLRLRMISAAIMAPAALLGVYLGGLAFGALLTCAAAIGLYEWMRLVAPKMPALTVGLAGAMLVALMSAGVLFSPIFGAALGSIFMSVLFLFCARDHMGIKPFYYYIDDDIFVFGTEIKALFGVPSVPYELNKLKVAFYLMDIDDNKSTFYENIFSCSSAHSLTITQNEIKTRQYWTIDLESNITMESDEDYAAAFRDIFSEAVKCRLRSAYPIGFELSGGLDSSSIVNTAKNIYKNNNIPNNLNTFSIIYNKIIGFCKKEVKFFAYK